MGGDNQAHPASPSANLRARWIGPALSDVALIRGNEPEKKHLVRLCQGLHPIEKVRLAPAKNRKRAYYDVTITAPKTVSLAALLIPSHPTARMVMDAHLMAVEEVAAAVGTMLQPQRNPAPRVAAWLGATFPHTHTREGDPHLHTHVVLPNMMRNTMGQWRAMQVHIAGMNRTYLGLIYNQALTRHLRRMGIMREELRVKRGGEPELRALLPLVERFSKAQRAVLAAAAAAEAKRPLGGAPAKSEWPEMHSRSKMPVPTERPAMQRRARLADQLRRPKPKDADDPVRLSDEARRWQKALSNQESRSLSRLLDELDYTSPHRRVRVLSKLPPAVARLVENAYLAESARLQRNPSEPLLLRAAVARSAGLHPFEELRVACEVCLAGHQAGIAKAMKRIREGFVAEGEARRAAFLRGQADSRAQPASVQPASGPAKRL